MSSSPAVSVVITCYNLGEFLDEAVDSVLAQTFQDFEILIVDDGSTGETAAKLASYSRPKTRVMRIENSGLPAARNAGIRQTTGEFLCMLDADDALEPSYMEKSVEALRADPSLSFASHWLKTFGDETGEWKPRDCGPAAMFPANPVNGAAMFRRDAWAAVGGFDESMREGLEDWDFWLTLVERGYRGTILPECLFRYRRRADSMSQAMHRGSYARLYRRLIDKHPATYRQCLPAMIGDVEREAGSLLAHIHQLEAERYAWLEPQLLSARDDVSMLEARLARQRERLAADEERARLVIERDQLRAERDQIVRGLDHMRSELVAMHQSRSWAVTRPMRTFWGWILKMRTRR